MPYIELKTTVPVDMSKKEELREDFGKAITLVPGKTEDVLMVEIEDQKDMWLGASKLDKGAYLSVDYFGVVEDKYLDLLNDELFKILKEKLSLQQEQIYVTFTPRADWGMPSGCIHGKK